MWEEREWTCPPAPRPKRLPHPDRAPGPDRRLRPLAGQAHGRRHRCRSRPTSSATATRCCAPSSAGAGPGERALARGAADAGRRPPRRRALGGRLHRRQRRAARSGRSRRGSTSSPAGATSSRASSRPASPTSAASSARAPCCSRAAADARQGRRPRGAWQAAAEAIATDPRRRAATPTLARARRARRRPRTEATELPAAARGRRRPHAARASAPGTSCSRARGAASRASQAQLPRLAELGFDVLYLPPIHPIGHTNRKGRNNTLDAPSPATPAARRRSATRPAATTRSTPSSAPTRTSTRSSRPPREHGIDVALDFAINCSPDHPWLKEHPEWFYRRPDGTLKYAENPPKKYQDIYNVNFGSEDWRGLWEALLEVVRHWVDRGVQRLPRRQPAHQAVRLLGVADRARSAPTHPDVIFLAEAFTRRAVMRELAKLGFTQSYTYFTWKNCRWELERVRQRARPRRGARVLPAELLRQHAGHPHRLPRRRAARRRSPIRLVLAATLSPSYGIYSGYEHFEHVPAPGQRGVPRQREVRAQAARASTARCCR